MEISGREISEDRNIVIQERDNEDCISPDLSGCKWPNLTQPDKQKWTWKKTETISRVEAQEGPFVIWKANKQKDFWLRTEFMRFMVEGKLTFSK